MIVSPYRERIHKAAAAANLDPFVFESLVIQESASRADAFRFEPGFWDRYLKDHPAYRLAVPRRVASSYGLTQVMYTTAVEHGYKGEPEGLFDIEVNLALGAMILSRLVQWAEGDYRKALAAYNGGKGNWKAERPQRYAAEVLDRAVRLAPPLV